MKYKDGYEEVTDVIVTSEMIYLNARKAMDFLAKVAPGAGVETLRSVITTDYISMSITDLQALIKRSMAVGKTVGDLFTEFANPDMAKDLQDYMRIFTDVVGNKVIAELEKVEPAVVGKDGSKHTITISDKNIQGLVTTLGAFIEEDGAGLYDELTAKVKEEKGVDDQFYNLLENAKVSVKDQMKRFTDAAKEKVETGSDKIKMAAGISVDGEKGKRTGTFDMLLDLQSETSGTVNLSMTMKEGEAVEYEVPQKAMSAIELMSMFGIAGTDGASR